MDADFGNRHGATPPGLRRWHERDDGHLIKSPDPLADNNVLEELIRIVNEAQERDAKDDASYTVPQFPRASHSNGGGPIDCSYF